MNELSGCMPARCSASTRCQSHLASADLAYGHCTGGSIWEGLSFSSNGNNGLLVPQTIGSDVADGGGAIDDGTATDGKADGDMADNRLHVQRQQEL